MPDKSLEQIHNEAMEKLFTPNEDKELEKGRLMFMRGLLATRYLLIADSCSDNKVVKNLMNATETSEKEGYEKSIGGDVKFTPNILSKRTKKQALKNLFNVFANNEYQASLKNNVSGKSLLPDDYLNSLKSNRSKMGELFINSFTDSIVSHKELTPSEVIDIAASLYSATVYDLVSQDSSNKIEEWQGNISNAKKFFSCAPSSMDKELGNRLLNGFSDKSLTHSATNNFEILEKQLNSGVDSIRQAHTSQQNNAISRGGALSAVSLAYTIKSRGCPR